jgi:DNA-binding response OmpR family regulator
MAKRILIVEDDQKTAAFLSSALQEAGYQVELCGNGSQALELILRQAYDGVILDVMLPGRDGLGVVKQLRERNHSVPVLMLSARGEMTERIEGLEAGADDYLAKPFGIAEVLARMKALTRRGGETKVMMLEVGDLQMEVAGQLVHRAGERILLAPQEFRLLECLMRHSPDICPRSLLLSEAWGYQFDPGTNIVDVYIRRLRAKIDFGPGNKLLHTVKGMGYVLGEPK